MSLFFVCSNICYILLKNGLTETLRTKFKDFGDNRNRFFFSVPVTDVFWNKYSLRNYYCECIHFDFFYVLKRSESIQNWIIQLVDFLYVVCRRRAFAASGFSLIISSAMVTGGFWLISYLWWNSILSFYVKIFSVEYKKGYTN